MLSARPLDVSFYAGPIVRRLGELGYREGAGMILEFRSADGFADRYPKQARELIALKCDLIFVVGPELPVQTLRDAHSPVPVVFLAIDYDPLEKRVVTSLSRPDSNITGVYVPQGALAAKRLEIMREVVPTARRFLVLADVFSKDQLEAVRRTANAARGRRRQWRPAAFSSAMVPMCQRPPAGWRRSAQESSRVPNRPIFQSSRPTSSSW